VRRNDPGNWFAGALAVMAFTACSRPDHGLPTDREQIHAQIVRRVKAVHALEAFGGTIAGTNQGEFGGEVAFRESNGTAYTVIDDNSVGSFEMPYGVIAVTGLAHLGINRGAVHLLSRPKGARVTARLLLELPGAPCDVLRVDDRLMMRIPADFIRHEDGSATRRFDCYVLESAKKLTRYECPDPPADVEACFS